MTPTPGHDQVGLVGRLDAVSVLDALRAPTRGVVYDLDATRWNGMPVGPGHPQFQVLTYRSAPGSRNQGDMDFLEHGNAAQLRVNTDLIMGTVHTGTHIDAFAHVCCGPAAEWFGGYSAFDQLGDFGALTCDASTIPPIVTRGVLIDVAADHSVPCLPRATAITSADLASALDKQQVELRENDVVLVRTGYMSIWPDITRTSEYAGAGIDHGAAVYLADRGAIAIGGDTEALEVFPSGNPDNPLPVHIELLQRRGIHILELVDVEALAADQVFEFLFVCLPLKIRGATGSLVRPIAIA
jgi:kynurenine formamidase